MQLKQAIPFLGGLNRDDDPRLLPEGDYPYMRNARSGSPDEQQDEGLAVSLKNVVFREKSVESFTEHHLGLAIDTETQKAYIMLYSDTASLFIIYEFDPSTNTYALIVRANNQTGTWSISGSTKFINPRVVHGNLILTDNVNPPMMINIERARTSWDTLIGYPLNGGQSKPPLWDVSTAYVADDYVFYIDRFYKALQATTGDIPADNPLDWEDLCAIEEAYADITQDIFLFEAVPPLISAIPAYQSDTNVKVNNLRGSVYQFSYRYVYMDFRRSTYAPPSEIAAPNGEETATGILNKDISLNNSIKITLSAPSPDVRAIEVIGRSSEDPASWFEIETVPIVSENGDRTVGYDLTMDIFWYNDRVKQAVDQSEVYELFTYVPIRASLVEIIEGNRVVFANVTEGYSGVRPLVSASLSYTNLSSVVTSYPMSSGGSIKEIVYPNITWVLLFALPFAGEVGATYRITIHPSGGSELQAEYTMVAGDAATYPTSVKTGLQAAMTTAGMEVATCAAGATDHSICAYERTVHESSFPYTGWSYSGLVLTPSYLNKYPHLKFGATHKLAMVYRDQGGRMCGLIRDNNFDISIPFYTENTNANMNTIPVVDLYITHKPPAWAVSYEILYARSNIQNPLQLKATGWAVDGNYWRFQIQQTQNDMYDNRSGWKVAAYQWEEGDRVRFIGVSNGVDSVTEEDGVLVDLEITKTDDVSGVEYLYVQATSDITMPGNTSLYIVEIYKPIKELSETIYYTTGMTFAVSTINSFKYHKGDTDQALNVGGDVVTPARVRITAHDVWKFKRVNYDNGPTNTFTFWAESAFPSDWYSTNYMTSQGLPVPEIQGYGQVTLDKRLRHGGILVPGSKVNYIATFDFDDFEDLQEQYGTITGIREVGYVLKVIQHHKVSSIYISRLETFNASGNPELIFTQNVIGSVRPSQEDYGCQDPDSIEVHDRYLYFWDQKYGVVIRDTANGMTPISDVKMKRYFLDKSKAIYDSTPNLQVVIGYNPKADEVWVSFRVLGSQAETVIFSERSKRWRFFADNYVNEYWAIGRRFFVEYDIRTFEYDNEDATGFLNWNDQEADSEVEVRVVSNIEKMKQKIFQALAVYSNQQPVCDQVIIPIEASEAEKETELHPANWNQREGIWYGKILRDKNTPGVFADDTDRELNGRVMRGEYAQFRLKWSSTTEQLKLYSVMVLSTPSERSR